MDRKKIAIIGGGAGAMTAAYYLAPHHDVSVYQLGWRLGGKGASGRNLKPGYGNRIEEHGLHIWMGFYENAFRLMREVYGALGRPPEHPLRNWDDAFKPQDVVTIMENVGRSAQWAPPWTITFARNERVPGSGTPHPERIKHVISIIEWARARADDYLLRAIDGALLHPVKVRIVQQIHEQLSKLVAAIGAAGGQPLDDLILDTMRLIQAALQIAGRYNPKLLDDDDFRHLYVGMDIAAAVLTGIIRSKLLQRPWESIDDLDFHQWLMQNGLTPFSRWSAPIRAIYDLAFGYEDGIADDAHANMAAGSTLRGLLWMFFGYAGSIMYKMQAGMGDTVFAPIYQLLVRDYNVPFYFFKRVLELIPSDDGTRIETIRIGAQAHPKKGPAGYEPLFTVNGVESWPSEPFWDQLEEGDTQADFESSSSTYTEEKPLQAGVDFDHVIFGASLGSVPELCARLIGQKPAWRTMVEQVKTVRTQAFQLWLNQDVKQLGWPPAVNGTDHGERAVMGTFVEPMDTWADMSQLIPRETWAPELNVQNVSYFCGPFAVPAGDGGPLGNGMVRAFAQRFVGQDLPVLWPNAASSGGFPFQWLVTPRDVQGIERFNDQFFRLNFEGSELYVLSVKGSRAARIAAAETGYENLSIAGDWNRNRLSLGCVESAVMGGIEAVQHLAEVRVVDEEGEIQIGSD